MVEFHEVGLRHRETKSDIVLVTFGNYRRSPSMKGFFAWEFAKKHNLTIVALSAGRNHWWNTSGFVMALDTVKHIADGRPIVTYGSSMGGFGAILASRWLNPVRIIAASPQTMVGPAAPWEQRWNDEFSTTDFLYPSAAEVLTSKPQVFVLYDPMHKPDAAQARPILSRPNVTPLPVPWGGHPVLETMREGGFLSRTIFSLITGDFCAADFGRIARARRLSSSYLTALAWASAKRKSPHLDKSLDILNRTIEWPGLSPVIKGNRLAMRARLLKRMERFEEALDAMDQLDRLHPPTSTSEALRESIQQELSKAG